MSAEERGAVVRGPLLSRLRLNAASGRAAASAESVKEARCSRLLRQALAAQILKDDSADEGGGGRARGVSVAAPLVPTREASGNAERPALALLAQMHEGLAALAAAAAARCTEAPTAAAESLHQVIVEAEAEAEAEAAGSAKVDGDGPGEGAVAEARQRLAAERAMFATLGQLRVAAAESSVVLGALAADSWCDLLLGLLHVASPRCARLALLLLGRTLPLCAPGAVTVRVPGKGDRRPLIPFVLELIGAEVAEGRHVLAIGASCWRTAAAWQGVVDASVALLRRLILAETWRETLLAALVGAVQAAPKVLRQGAPPSTVRDVGVGAIAAFCVLGGHLWSSCPGARVSVLDSPEWPGTVVAGSADATTLLIAADGSATAPGATEVVQVASSRVRCRPQVKLPPALLLPH